MLFENAVIASGVMFWLWVVLFPIKMWAIWEAAKREQLGWFVCFFFVHVFAIPEIVYLVWFRKDMWR